MKTYKVYARIILDKGDWERIGADSPEDAIRRVKAALRNSPHWDEGAVAVDPMIQWEAVEEIIPKTEED